MKDTSVNTCIMYKVIYIDRYNIAKLIEQDFQPDQESVVCFSGDETDPIPHVYLDHNSEIAIETRRWAKYNMAQQQMFKGYFGVCFK